MNFIIKKYYRYLPVVVYYCLIFYLSSKTISINIGTGDKILHIIEYAGFGFLLAFGLDVYKFKYVKIIKYCFITAITAGFLDELHQFFVPGRTADLFDIVADVAGVFIGLTAFLFLAFIVNTNQENEKAL